MHGLLPAVRLVAPRWWPRPGKSPRAKKENNQEFLFTYLDTPPLLGAREHEKAYKIRRMNSFSWEMLMLIGVCWLITAAVSAARHLELGGANTRTSRPTTYLTYTHTHITEPATGAIGEGSFGAVYRARLDGAPCVAKRAAAGERAAQFFETEAHVNRQLVRRRAGGGSAVLRPSCIASYIGEFEASGQLHLVWERCGEATLGEYLERGDEGRVELTAALGCVASELPRRTLQLVLEALAHIHSLGVVHRDVKPHNLLVDTRGRTLALIDFGSACDVAGWVVQRGLEAGRVPCSVLRRPLESRC